MAYQSFDQLIGKMGAQKKRRVVVAAAQDSHALEAVVDAHEKGIVDYVLVGDHMAIVQVANEHNLQVNRESIFQADTDQEAAAKAVELIRQGA